MKRQTKEQLKTISSFFTMTPKEREKARLKEQIEKFLNNGGKINREIPTYESFMSLPVDSSDSIFIQNYERT